MPKHFFAAALLVISILLGMYGCGSDEGKPPPASIEDPILKEELLGSWNVTSINDGPASAFLMELIHENLKTDDPADLEMPVPLAPINGGNRKGEFVDITEEEVYVDYQVKIDVNKFTFNFTTDDLWTLQVQLSMIPNDETDPLHNGEVSQASDPGQGEDDPPPLNDDMKEEPSPNDMEPPPDDEEPPPDDSEVLSGKVEVQGTWSGTYSISSDSFLSLVVKEKDVNVTSHPEEFLQKLSEITEEEAQKELLEKFRIRLLERISKTFITIEGETLNLEAPGSSPVKMLLEKQ